MTESRNWYPNTKKNINNIVSRGTVPYSFSETHKKGIARCNSFFVFITTLLFSYVLK